MTENGIYRKYLVKIRSPLEAMLAHKKQLEEMLDNAKEDLAREEETLVSRRETVRQLIAAVAEAEEACRKLDTPTKVASLSAHRRGWGVP